MRKGCEGIEEDFGVLTGTDKELKAAKVRQAGEEKGCESGLAYG